MQAKRKYLPILLAVLMAMATVAACSGGGGGGQGQTWFNLPSLSVAFDANGNASVYGIGLGPLLTPDQLQMLQALGQKVELRIGYNGVHVYVNGEDQIYLAWDDESVANLLAVAAGIPGGDAIAEGLPWLRRIGLGAAITLPAADGAALDLPRWRGETAISAEPSAQPGDPLVLGVSFDESGSGSIGSIPGSALAALTGGANPLQLDAALLGQLRSLGIGNIQVATTPSGIALTVDGKRMPGIAYDAAYLGRLKNLLPAVLAGDQPTQNLLGGVLTQLPSLNLAVTADLTGEPTELQLPDLPVEVEEDGGLQLLGLELPGVTLPAETLQPLRDAGIGQLALDLSTESIDIAVDGQTLPRIRFGPNGLNILAGIASTQAGLPAPLLDALTGSLLQDGLSTRIALSGAAEDVAVPGEPSFAPAELGEMAAPVIHLSATIRDGQIVSAAGLSADQLAGLGVDLPLLPEAVTKIFADLNASTVEIVNSGNTLSLLVDGTELVVLDHDAASLSAALVLAKPYLAGTPLESPALQEFLTSQILPMMPALDLAVRVTIE